MVSEETNGDVVVGYGAAHKGNTFLNAVANQEFSSTLWTQVLKSTNICQGLVSYAETEKLNTDNPTDV